ncbi:MAG: glycosyltransferase family 39 protein [Candidatus Aenigmarchaeota archaeon]|nr:glycosyltransferase family 39 protein [Candidatus Aenigmarchaeota archaeon]
MKRFKKAFLVKFEHIFPLILFILIRPFFITPVPSDETIYINMAKALKEGLLPYKDFFYAHPPFQLLLLFPAAQTGNFFLTKVYISIIGLACVFLTYLIAKKIFDERTAFISMLFFLLFPGFIIFGNLAMGTFEALFFFLLSFYFLLKERLLISAIFMSISIFTRYLVLFLIPLVLIYLFLYNRKILKGFLIYFAFALFGIFLVIYYFFGFKFIRDTIIYHFWSNIKLSLELADWIWQYLSLGFFTEFISFISLAFGYLKKDYKLIIFSAYPIIYDFVILLTFKQVIYHYFAFVLPFLSIAFGRTFSSSRFLELKIFLILILFISLFSNFQSLIYYFDKSKNYFFDELVSYTLQLTEKNDLIFGEPRSINYISFVTDRKIVNSYFDSDLKYLSFEGFEKVVEEVKKSKPKIMVVDANYYKTLYNYFEGNYEIIKEWYVPSYCNLILMKSLK